MLIPYRYRCVTGGDRSPLPFFKNCKKSLNLEKKCPDCGHLWVKCLSLNDFFKSFYAEKQEILSLLGLSFSCCK